MALSGVASSVDVRDVASDVTSINPQGIEAMAGPDVPILSDRRGGALPYAARAVALGALMVYLGSCLSPHSPVTGRVGIDSGMTASVTSAAGGSGPANAATGTNPSRTNESVTGALSAPNPSSAHASATGDQGPSVLELPRGGRTIFPEYRLVGFCGTPGAPALGELQGNLKVKAKALEAQAAHYAEGRKLLPVFELIAVVVQSYPGSDGKYRRRVEASVVDDYLRAARQSKALLLLNIQPGQSDFMSEIKTFETYLREPDVGIAMDPEWAMKGKQKPGVFYGQTTGETVNEVAAYLSGLVAAGNLPEKALVYHEVLRQIVKDEGAVRSFPGVALIKSVDGLGPVHSKIVTYGNLMEVMAAGVHPGFKLFFDEDTRNGSRLMTAKEVLTLTPQPEYVMYE